MRASTICTLIVSGFSLLAGQGSSDPPITDTPIAAAQPSEGIADADAGRILGVIPDNKIVPREKPAVEPLTSREKYMLATKDTIDPFTFVLAGFYSGIAQWQNDYPTLGQGGAAYGRRFGDAYADQAIGNYLTEAIMPALLHEDPRYFRKGSGTKRGRLGYALTRVLITRTDRGNSEFNYSEVAGNAIAAGLSDLYYPRSGRTAGEASERLFVQLVSDAAFNVLLEFWPDMKHKFLKR